MATRRVNDPKSKQSRGKPPTTPEAWENRLIGLSMEAAEDMIQGGSPPAQVVTHFLKLGSSREKLEQERLAHEVELLKIKRETIAAAQRVETLYSEAMDAFRGYSGQAPIHKPSDEEYDD